AYAACDADCSDRPKDESGAAFSVTTTSVTGPCDVAPRPDPETATAATATAAARARTATRRLDEPVAATDGHRSHGAPRALCSSPMRPRAFVCLNLLALLAASAVVGVLSLRASGRGMTTMRLG